jgi:hypothetical protein
LEGREHLLRSSANLDTGAQERGCSSELALAQGREGRADHGTGLTREPFRLWSGARALDREHQQPKPSSALEHRTGEHARGPAHPRAPRPQGRRSD